jgi:hypothetical protein
MENNKVQFSKPDNAVFNKALKVKFQQTRLQALSGEHLAIGSPTWRTNIYEK